MKANLRRRDLYLNNNKFLIDKLIINFYLIKINVISFKKLVFCNTKVFDTSQIKFIHKYTY